MKPKVYSVPHRYDLATMLVATMAFSGLFGGLKLLGMPPAAFFIILALVAIVSLSQAAFPSAPRAASAVSTAVGIVLLVFVSTVMDGAQVILSRLLLAIPLFALLGYVVGTLIGAVFLVADYLRRWTRPS